MPLLTWETVKSFLEHHILPLYPKFKLGVGKSTLYLFKAHSPGWEVFKYKGCFNYNIDRRITGWIKFREGWVFPRNKKDLTMYTDVLEVVKIKHIVGAKHVWNHKDAITSKYNDFISVAQELGSSRTGLTYNPDSASLDFSNTLKPEIFQSYKLHDIQQPSLRCIRSKLDSTVAIRDPSLPCTSAQADADTLDLAETASQYGDCFINSSDSLRSLPDVQSVCEVGNTILNSVPHIQFLTPTQLETLGIVDQIALISPDLITNLPIAILQLEGLLPLITLFIYQHSILDKCTTLMLW